MNTTNAKPTARRVTAAAIGTMLALLAGGAVAVQASATTKADSSGPILIIARSGDMNTLDAQLAAPPESIQTLGLIYNSLFALNPILQLEPSLATSWSFNSTDTQLTLNLRSGVKFDDGSLFTSADVKASLERIEDPATGAVDGGRITAIHQILTPNPLTVVLNLSSPDPTLPYVLADDTNAAMYPAAAIKAGTIERHPDGTGPFVFVSWKEGQSVTLKANPNYWGGKPKVAGIEFRVVNDQASIISGLRAKQYDFGIITEPSIVAEAPASLKVAKIGDFGYWALRDPRRHLWTPQ